MRGRCVRPKTTIEVGALGGTLLVEWVDQWRMPPTDTVLGWAPLFLVLLPSALEIRGIPSKVVNSDDDEAVVGVIDSPPLFVVRTSISLSRGVSFAE